MKKFSFRLERILQYKGQVEEQKRRDLSARLDELAEQNRILQFLTQKREEYRKRYSELFHGRVDIDALKSTRRYLDKIHRELVLQAKKVVDCEKKVAKAKAILLEAMRDRKKYENLKERKYKAYIKESNLAEQKTLDEFATQAAARKIESVFR
jgi:flagellar protein FliJ